MGVPARESAGILTRARRGAGWLRGSDLGPETELLTRRVFLGLLGLVYLAAFLSLWVQVQGLMGSAGIAPAAERLEQAAGAARFWRLPSLLWLWPGDAALHLMCAAGAAAALGLVLGAAPRALLALLWLLYLSMASVGGIFLRYQWDALLLETGFLAIWLAPARLRPRDAAREPVEPLALWLLRFLLFKLMFMSGAVKLLSGDPAWRDGSAMGFHYWTQPLPTWSAWWVDRLPAGVHAVSVTATFVVELALPFLIFAPRRLRWLACAGCAGLQLLIGTTGSYGFFNLLTLALCCLLLDDAVWRRVLPRRLRERGAVAPGGARRRGWPAARIAFAALALLLFAMSGLRMLDRLGVSPWRPAPLVALNRVTAPLQIANAYGLFAVMTKQRHEIQLEGSNDGHSWRPYVFRWKPGPVGRRPDPAGLHMPRLDWQMWFAALRGCGGARWFHRFMARVLEGEPSVLALLEENPFPDAPPRILRSRLWDYRFAPPEDSAWWRRESIGSFCPSVTLDGGRLLTVRPGS